MTDGRGYHGPPWRSGGREWGGPGFGPGRRFRRGALVFLLAVVLLVAVLATVVASALAGNAPAPWITVVVSAFVLSGLVISVRWLWRNARAVGSLMDAADRVAGGDYATRVPETGARQLNRLTGAFNQMAGQLATNEQRRRELLADVAHELRTPLQVIRGTLEGMLDGLYPADPDRLQPLLDETIVMARLLDDLRTLSTAEAGVLELHRETVDPRALADDAVQAFRSIADKAGVTLTSSYGADAPSTIEADPVRLGEVLSNLLTNALRHTPSGGRVAVSVDGVEGVCVVVVEDTGRGIPSDQLPTVFDRFVTSADTEGTGLGLAIAKRLVQAHGGTIEATRNASGGTTIRFQIPRSQDPTS
jgi:two-component system, OmpR family, sensor histidine kinase BaeS